MNAPGADVEQRPARLEVDGSDADLEAVLTGERVDLVGFPHGDPVAEAVVARGAGHGQGDTFGQAGEVDAAGEPEHVARAELDMIRK